MWNFLVGGLLTEASIVLYDGNPGTPDLGVLWDLAEAAGITCFGTSAAYIGELPEGRPAAGRGTRPLGAAVGRLDRLAALAGGVRLGLRGARRGHLAVLDLRRHRRLHRVRRRRPDAARLPGRAAGARARRPRRGVEPRRAVARRRGRRARDHRADAVDAALLLGRRGRQPLPRELLRDVPRRLAPRRLDRDHRPRHRDHLRPLRRDDQPRRRSGWGRARSTGPCSRSTRSSTRSCSTCRCPGTDGYMPLFVVLRDGVDLDDDLVARIRRRIREDCSPRHVPDSVEQIAEVPRTLSGKALELPVKRILLGAARRDDRQPRRARQPRPRSTPSRRWPGRPRYTATEVSVLLTLTITSRRQGGRHG